ncbi:VOC family protein [Mangrovivirga sp. M17]|uniref:VOC family protein n=1 Tax=Mangrovivirga halotolerans TaxID=2993936 RepID=A0ABT3RLW8_9BACT|nr:VOC family protein [Mangrovivirga halotolerans]MCX2742802.1 VOC family protein [Mangrovivirga halotolerans]
MKNLTTYLMFDGQCEEAFNFYKSVFGGDFISLERYKHMPPSEKESPEIPDEHADRIMHISLKISDEIIIMGSDTAGKWVENYRQGNNFSISIDTENKEEADKLFKALSEDGNVTMPQVNTFWGAYFGSVEDKYGVNWMVNLDT